MKPLIIYHGGECRDGFCAAWIIHRLRPDAELYPAIYGQDPPDVAGRDVDILDFSYPRDVLLAMEESARSLFVLDHHASAQKDLSDLPFCTFNMNKSGARLTWDLFGLGPSPWLVDYTEDRDLWRHALPYSKEINAALRSYPLDFDVWDDLAKRDPYSLIHEGTAIRRAEKQIIDTHIRNAKVIELGGHKIMAVNATVFFSEIAGELAKGRPFGACFFERHDGKRQWSLRSDENGVDVSEVAKQFGGGGHKQSAGFEQVVE
jgi:uncharacterized protein